MNRPPTCHFYQAGFCKNGDNCIYSHPVVKCNNFSNTGWCPYGHSCHFWHDHSTTLPTSSNNRKPCSFFLNNQCKYGDSCAFNHENHEHNGDKALTLSEFRLQQKPAVVKLVPNRDTSPQQPVFSSLSTTAARTPPATRNREPVQRPINTQTVLPWEGVTKTELYRLNYLELDRFLKSFPQSKVRLVSQSDEGKVYSLRFASSDPDWVYDVREITLLIKFHRLYPLEPLEVTVTDKEFLPKVLISHLNYAIATWIRGKHHMFNRSNRVELYLRPLLQWLDKNLEHLFTGALRKMKASLSSGKQETEVEATQSQLNEAGDDVVVSGTRLSASRSLVETDHSAVLSSDSGEEAEEDQDQEQEQEDEDEDDDDDKSEADNSVEELLDTMADLLPHKRADDEEEAGYRKRIDELESGRKSSNLFSPCAPQPKGDVSVIGSDGESTPSSYPCAESQSITLQHFKLCGKAGTYLQQRLSIMLHCTRCRLPSVWIFHLPGHLREEENTEVTTTTSSETGPTRSQLRSLPPHRVQCARCRQPHVLLYHASLAHAFESRIGSLYLSGCVADDVIANKSGAHLHCIECNTSVKFSNLVPDSPNLRRCFTCHSVIGFNFSGFRLGVPLGGAASAVAAANLAGVNKLGDSIKERQSRKGNLTTNCPIVQEGVPLPSYGTCQHYRKSYRWLRFPCCGRLEPCDVCHDVTATDGHEMEFANRMVCGFCSKEQAYSATGPCVGCGKSLTGAHSTHWEGGKGCRDKVKMCRNDRKKYANMTKTTRKLKVKK